MFDLIPFHHRNRLRKLGDEIEDLFERVFSEDVLSIPGKSFRADIKETEHDYIIEAELPGFDKDNIEVELYDNKLTIKAQQNEIVEEKDESYIRKERRSGTLTRCFYVDNVDPNKVDAKYEKGILHITLGKKDPGKGKRHRIDIK